MPHTILEGYVKLESNSGNKIEKKFPRQLDLTNNLQEFPVELCLDMERCFFGLAMNDVRRLACYLAQKITYKTRFLRPVGKLKKRLNIFFGGIPSCQSEIPKVYSLLEP